MRHRALLFAVASTSLVACSDGIGKPILRGNVSGNVVTPNGNNTERQTDAGSEAGVRDPSVSLGDLPGDSTGLGLDAVPDTAYCADVRHDRLPWSLSEKLFAENMINQHRSFGSRCGGQFNQEAAPALKLIPELRCSARKHSKSMAAGEYVNTVDASNPAERTPPQRMALAGYEPTVWWELVYRGTMEEAQEQLLNSADCERILSPDYVVVGVGYHPFSNADPAETMGPGYWTIDLAAQ